MDYNEENKNNVMQFEILNLKLFTFFKRLVNNIALPDVDYPCCFAVYKSPRRAAAVQSCTFQVIG